MEKAKEFHKKIIEDRKSKQLKDNSRPKDNSKLYNEIGYQSFLDDLNSIDEF
ncbi:hypothetical protein N9V16_02770 [SAR116 cluster bacterium]|nr:hypothetical protein [SAR116 cluster bacterium]